MSDLAQNIHELKQNACLIASQKRGILKIAGKDAKDFLQRMSTNDIRKLNSQSPLHTSFINNKGRIIDHCVLFEVNDREIIMVSSHNHGQPLFDWLEQFHFVEDFLLTDVSKNFSFSYVLSALSKEPLIKGCFAFRYWQGHLPDLSFDFYAILNGIIDNAISIDPISFETLRIASLMPASPFEINNNFMPQNINLENFIADNKGCYIGQEVIAKARTYQKNVKTLCGVVFLPKDFSQVSLNSHVESSDGEHGFITSLAPSYIKGAINALAITVLGQKVSTDDKETIKASAPFVRRI
jgi:folate-binding protein YgfZ